MGRYVCYDGVIDFKEKKHFDAFLKLMIEDGWYDPKIDSWLSESGPIRNIEDEDDWLPVVMQGEGLFTVILPNYQINNFGRLISCLEDNTWEGEIRSTSDDGDFEGYIYHPDGTFKGFLLDEWAKENNLSLEWDDDSEDWLTEDRCDVMDAFIENPYPPTNSMKFILTEDSDEKKIISP